MEVKPTVDFNFMINQSKPAKIANIIQPPIKLSILIATMPSRRESYLKLWDMLAANGFEFPEVEVISDNSMAYNIGVKRNKLIGLAKGEYIVFIDDDDHISPDYVRLILEACETGTDCIGINGIITTNGLDKRQWFISKEYGRWFTGADGTYFRTPNHISPVKRELALQAGFPEISFGEDAEYSRRLLPLLRTETIISQPLYHYDFWEHKTL